MIKETKHQDNFLRDVTIVTSDPVFLGLSNDEEERHKHYIELVIDSNLIDTEKLKNQLFIGSEEFIERSKKSYQIKVKPKRGRPKK